MCFSAPGSFILGTGLIGSGIYSVRQVKDKKFLPLAVMPLLFGVQQVIEGGVWLALAAHNQILTKMFALGFLFFATFLWPVYTAFVSYRLAPVGWRKKAIQLLLWGGIIISFCEYILYFLTDKILNPTIIYHSISYNSYMSEIDPRFLLIIYLIYGIIIFGSIIMSANREFYFFGVLLALACLITIAFFFYAFTSVWCIFSAILSLSIIKIIKKRPNSPA